VSEVAAVTSRVDAGKWLPAEHFAASRVSLQPSILPNLPQPLRKNKTAGLVTREGSEADGD